MKESEGERFSAQVVLRSAGGEAPPAPEEVTAENVGRLMPSPEDLQRAMGFFGKLKFTVEGAFGNSFSITADRALFEETFGVELMRDKRGGVKAQGADGGKSSELPLDKLPKEQQRILHAVTFTEPPDFGPGNF